jgi:hypothetical protein
MERVLGKVFGVMRCPFWGGWVSLMHEW